MIVEIILSILCLFLFVGFLIVSIDEPKDKVIIAASLSLVLFYLLQLIIFGVI